MEVTIADLVFSAEPAPANNNSDTANIWINPNLAGSLGTEDAIQHLTFDYVFQKLRLFAGGDSITQGRYAELAVDEIRLGQTADDVRPIVLQGAVPEATSFLIWGVLGLIGCHFKAPP